MIALASSFTGVFMPAPRGMETLVPVIELFLK